MPWSRIEGMDDRELNLWAERRLGIYLDINASREARLLQLVRLAL